MIQFFAPDIVSNPILPESDSQHCIKVLRRDLGDIITVIDGHGHRLECEIIDPHPKHTLVKIVNTVNVAQPWFGNITVAVAPTKHLDRMEWMVEKLTEVGVNRIVPLLCSRSERKELKIERLNKIAVSAMKQSLKAELPVIDEMTPIARFISECNSKQKFVAYCDDSCIRLPLANAYNLSDSVTIMIGPEGDFSPDEIAKALDAEFLPVTLGDCRLRTETAALAACQTFHIVNQFNSLE